MNGMKWIALLVASVSVMSAQSAFDGLVDRYFQEDFHLNPSFATASGIHKPYDAQLEDYSRAGIDRQIALDSRYLPLFEKMPQTDDRDWMISHLHANLLANQQIRQWEKNPDIYSSGPTGSIFSLISRKFAPPEERMRDVIAREKQMPPVFEAAKANLKNPPRIYTEIALEQLPGIEGFYANDVPAAFTAVKDPALLAEFKQTNQATIRNLKQYEQWMRADLLPRSHGDFRIGADNFHKKVAYEEMVDLPLDRLLAIGYANLQENQQQLVALCKTIDPNKTPQQIAARFQKDYPAPDQLLQTFRNTLSGLIDFIHQNKIIEIPSTVRPILEETPPFLRAVTTASMDAPGPYEKVATEAYFNVTLPGKSWSKERTAEFMTAFSRGTIISTAIHEAYPGHYVQLLWFQRVQSKVRKLVGSNSNIEGWAHYCEQMMIDQGYGNNDPELRFGPVARCPIEKLPVHCGHRDAHGQDELRAGNRVLHEEWLHVARLRRARDKTRHGGPDISLLHARQARDFETPQGLPGKDGGQLLARAVPHQVCATGRRADQAGSSRDASRRFVASSLDHGERDGRIQPFSVAGGGAGRTAVWSGRRHHRAARFPISKPPQA